MYSVIHIGFLANEIIGINTDKW